MSLSSSVNLHNLKADLYTKSKFKTPSRTACSCTFKQLHVYSFTVFPSVSLLRGTHSGPTVRDFTWKLKMQRWPESGSSQGSSSPAGVGRRRCIFINQKSARIVDSLPAATLSPQEPGYSVQSPRLGNAWLFQGFLSRTEILPSFQKTQLNSVFSGGLCPSIVCSSDCYVKPHLEMNFECWTLTIWLLSFRPFLGMKSSFFIPLHGSSFLLQIVPGFKVSQSASGWCLAKAASAP